MTLTYLAGKVIQGLSTDTKPIANIQANTIFYETDTGDTLVSDGTYWWVTARGPFSTKKLGYLTWGNNISGGIGHYANLTASTGAGTQTQAIDTTNGRYQLCVSGTTSGNKGGYRNAAATLFTRAFNPKLRFRFKILQSTNARFYFGFLGTTIPELTGDNPLDNLHGFIFGVMPTTSATNWVLATNNGAATTTLTDTTVAFNTTGVHDLKLVGDDTNSRFSWSLDGGAYTHVTTNIPISATALSLIFTSETATTAAASFNLYNAFAQQDK